MTDRSEPPLGSGNPNDVADPAPVNRSPAALRALAEAEARRKAAQEPQRAAEIGGQKGPDPVRYGDWEKAGIASDF